MSDTTTLTDFEDQSTISETAGLTTLRAAHPDDQSAVTIKRFDTDANWFDADRFHTVLDHWRALADANPHVPEIVDAGFVAAPWVAVNGSLQRTAATQPLFEDVVVSITEAAADTLATAHARGLYHGHLDPAAIRFSDADDNPMEFVIGGWETALTALPQPRTTTLWDHSPTPPFLPPEHAGSDAATTISTSDAVVTDVYQLGMVAYAMLCHETPTTVPDRAAIATELSTGFPDREAFATALATAVAADPNDRYQSMAEFATALDDVRVRL